MKIGVNCGHTKTGAGSGAVGFISESAETRKVGNKLMELLKNNGHTVVNCTVDTASTQNEYLKKSVLLANAQDLDLFLSIHFNAGGGKGVEAHTYNGKSLDTAVRICSKIEALGFRNRGIKDGSNLYVVKNTKATAILVEVCFVDTETDVYCYKNVGAERIATAIYEAITNKAAPQKSNSKFNDISGHYAEKYINKLADLGVISGNGNGSYNPDKPITRADAAIIAAKVLEVMGK